MRHQKTYRKFGRSSSHRMAMMKNLATSLLEHGKIETTTAKAKDLRRVVEKLITKAGSGSLAARREALAYLTKKPVAHKLVNDIAPKFKSRPGGYTRIIKLGQRQSDAADMAVIELVEEDYKPKAKKKKRAAKVEKKAEEKKEAKAEEVAEDAPQKESAAEESAPVEESTEEVAPAEEEKKEE